MPRPGSIHDSFFKATFARREVAIDFVRHYLPASVAAVLDTDTLTLAQGSFVDPRLRQHHSDLLYRVQTRDGGRAFVYLLLEHKRRPDPLVAFQLLRYLVRIWEWTLRTGEGLVPVIPVVVYHGQAPWRVGRDFRDLYRGPEALQAYWPAFSYHLSDLSTPGGTELVGALWLQAILEVMRYIASPDLVARLPAVMVRLSTAEGVPGLADLWQPLVDYILWVNEAVDKAEVQAALDVGFAGQGEAMMATVVKQWIEQGLRQGRQEGRREGERRGVLASIEVGLQQRFGGDGLALMPSIAAIDDVARLLSIQSALFTAASVDDVRRLIGQADVDGGPSRADR